MSERGPSEAWSAAVFAVAAMFPEPPLPKQVIDVERGDWKLKLNNTERAVDLPHGTTLEPFEILAESKTCLAIGILGPGGGMLGGVPEDTFIAEMKALGQ